MISFDRDVQASEASYAKHRAEMGEPRPPRPLNTAGVVWLVDPMRVPFRGRMYEIPPLPYKAGIQVMQVQDQLAALRSEGGEDRLARLEKWASDAAALIYANVKPQRGRWRWSLRLHRNPFRKANFRELGELLGFLLRSQTTTSVVGGWDPATNQNPSTFSTVSRSSAGSIPRG